MLSKIEYKFNLEINKSTSIVLTSSPVDQGRGPYVFLLDDTRSTLIAKESPGGRTGNLDLIIKHDDRLMEKMEGTNRPTNENDGKL